MRNPFLIVYKGGFETRPNILTTAPMPKFVVVEGCIGAGKSTLLDEFRTRAVPGVVAVPEPVTNWGELLDLFYKDQREYALPFQLCVYMSRVDAIRAAVRGNPAADVFLLERAPRSDRMFMEMFRQILAPDVMRVYSQMCDAIDLTAPELAGISDAAVVFLNTPLEICMERVRSRGRAAELPVTLEYQRRLLAAHGARIYGKPFGGGEMTAWPRPRAVMEVETNVLTPSVLEFVCGNLNEV